VKSHKDELFEKFTAPMLGLQVSHLWQGHGSALFLEFGTLAQTTKQDGTPGHPEGELAVMIEWSWRIENAHAILCGSWSDKEL
jgi:hypothetical protein